MNLSRTDRDEWARDRGAPTKSKSTSVHRMKNILTAVWITLVSLATTQADPGHRGQGLRSDINPALLYWQAMSVLPDRANQDHLFTNEWRGRTLDAPFEQQITTFDNAFKLLRQASRQSVPCQWGYDLTQGPELLLPGLSKAKLLAQSARLRVLWHLEHHRPDDARDDLIAAFVLGRQVSKDGILISALVQVAMENILVSSIAENWFRFTPETLRQILDGLAAAPARGTIKECVATERMAFKDWYMRRIQEFRANSRDEAEALEKTRKLLNDTLNGGPESQETPSSNAEAILQSAGGTTEGLLRQLANLDPLYDEAAALMAAPYHQFEKQIQAFNEKIAHQTNPFAQGIFPTFEKCRLKELTVQTKLAMLRAGFEYQKSGPAGLGGVLDPVFNEPFQFSRFEFNGVDRGFQLSSKFQYTDNLNTAMIFIEKDGPAFYLEGRNAGKPVK